MQDILLEKIKLDKKEFYFQFQSHPDYPSALAFSDTLNFLGLHNSSYELQKEHWDELPSEFITIYNKKFALVQRDKTQSTVFSDTLEKISFNNLKENSETFIMLFEGEREGITSKKNSFSNYFLLTIFAIIILNNIIHWSIWSFLFQLLSLVGLFIFSELFFGNFGNNSPALQSFCGIGSNNKESEDSCKTVTESKDFTLFNLKFADFGFIYFTALSILPILISNRTILFTIITSLSLLSIIYSLYYQISKRIFCNICGLVILILLSQFFLSYFVFRNDFTYSELLVSFFVFIISFFGIHYVFQIKQQSEEFRKENVKNLAFKRNYNIFKRELTEGEKIIFSNPEEGFYFGSNKSKLHFSIVSNPYCGFCEGIHELVENLLQKHDNISVQIRFNFRKTDSEEYRKLLFILKRNYENSQKDFFLVLKKWYNLKKVIFFREQLKGDDISMNNFDTLYRIGQENIEKRINFTPALFINGFQFPERYERSDIYYFIEELLDDEEIFNEE